MAIETSSVFALLRVILDRLESRELPYFSYLRGAGSELKKFQINLTQIQAVLLHVEGRQLYETLKLWLDDLLDFTYDVDDIPDEIATDILGRRLVAKGSFSLIPACFSDLTPNIRMESKIKDMTYQFEELHKLGLQMIPREISTAIRKRPLPTYLPRESVIYKRDEDKDKTLEMVLSDESGYISIVGMRGIGKTRLVQEVYNDKALEGFNIRACVDVSSGTNIR